MSINEWSAHGQSDSNLGHKGQAVADTRTKSDSNLGRKGQAVADTRINRLTRWLTGSVSHLFTLIIMFYHFQENAVLARSLFCCDTSFKEYLVGLE